MSEKKPGKPKGLSSVKRRMVERHVAIAAEPPEEITYQHTVLCQTVLPYRDPGADVRTWEREQGIVSLRVEAGAAKNPDTGQWVELALPFGPKARLVLMHINREAMLQGSPTIEVEESMTAFLKRIQQGKHDPNGREIRAFKDQLSSLSASLIRLAVVEGGRAVQIDTKVVAAFDLWFTKDPNQRVLWPSLIRLSDEYFNSLARHAVPLDERAIAGLSHSAMALDVYAWLAQRLHRVKGGQFIPWTALHEQFGQGYKQIRQFRAVFLKVLTEVKLHYPAARFTADRTGLLLANSPPPVQKRLVMIEKPKG